MRLNDELQQVRHSTATILCLGSIGFMLISGCGGHTGGKRNVDIIYSVSMSKHIIEARIKEGDAACSEREFGAAADCYQISLNLLLTLKNHEANSPVPDESFLQWIHNRESIVQAKLEIALLGTEISMLDQKLGESGRSR